MFQRKEILLVALYLCVSTALYFFFQMKYLTSPLTFFFHDQTVPEKIHLQTTYDRDSVLLTRFLHNKPVAYAETYTTAVYRSVDPLFLFSFYEHGSLYENSDKRWVLLPIEALAFFFAVWWLIRTYKKSYRFLIPSGIVVVLATGLFLPIFHPLALLPLVIYIRLIIAMGIIAYVRQRKK